MAIAVAKDYNRREYTGRKIVKWEKEWVQNRRIPESKAGKHKVSLSLLDDEATLCAIRDFMKTQGEGRYNQRI
jgi:ABC-type ATPase with predicted acetyltransferase domain